MISSTITTLALLLAGTNAAALLPRQDQPTWQVTDFSVASCDGEVTRYSLLLTGEGQTNVSCTAVNDVESSVCAGADGPAPFNTTACTYGDEVTYFSWKFFEANSPTQPSYPGYGYQVIYNPPDGETLYGCSGLYNASNVTCYPGGEKLNAQSSFTLQPSNFSSECIYV